MAGHLVSILPYMLNYPNWVVLPPADDKTIAEWQAQHVDRLLLDGASAPILDTRPVTDRGGQGHMAITGNALFAR
jgi:hypothetical protein